MTRGWLVALEGIDGAGTTSQLAPVAAALRARGQAVCTTHQPSGHPVGRLLREALRTRQAYSEASLALLFAADRLQHWHDEMDPALARGEWVLCDRYVWSSLAYQGAALPHDWVAAINAQAPPADLTLWFDLPVDVAAARRRARGGAAERFDDAPRQQAVAARYAALYAAADAQQRPRAVRIDARLPLGEVTEHVLAALTHAQRGPAPPHAL